jgi:excisionase family DNA binding protein
LFDAPPKTKGAQQTPLSLALLARHPSERIEYVLTLGEAAGRLGVSRKTLEAMIDAGKIEALPTGFTRMIPTREVQRLAGKATI